MVSLAYLLTVLSVFSAVVTADEVKSDQGASTVEKWWRRYGMGVAWGPYLNGGYCYNGWGSTLPAWFNGIGSISAYGIYTYGGSSWLKAVGSPSTARRSISLENEHIYDRRDATHPETTVSCKNNHGQLDQLVAGDCQKAVKNLVSKKASSAHCNSCAVRLVDPHGQLAPSGVPAEALEQIANKILKACGESGAPDGGTTTPVNNSGSKSAPASPDNHARRSPADTSNSNSGQSQFAMIFQKGDGKNCDS